MTVSFSSTSRITLVAAGFFVLCAMSGCASSGTSGGSAPPTAQNNEDTIRKIQNNPNMPADAKAAAIASIRNPAGAQQAAAGKAAK